MEEMFEDFDESLGLLMGWLKDGKKEIGIMGGRYELPTNLYSFADSRPKGKKKYALAALGLMGLAAALSFLGFVYIPQQKKAQRIEQLKKIGLTEEQANSFDLIFSKYSDENLFSSVYNNTILDFASFYGRNPELAKKQSTPLLYISSTYQCITKAIFILLEIARCLTLR